MIRTILAPTAPAVAREIYRRMMERGLNKRSLALKAQLSESYVRDLFRGKSLNPKIDHLEKLAQALDCHVEDLTHPNVGSGDPEGSYRVDPSGILPLRPGEYALIRLWRYLSIEAKDQVLLRATELLPPTKRRSAGSE